MTDQLTGRQFSRKIKCEFQNFDEGNNFMIKNIKNIKKSIR